MVQWITHFENAQWKVEHNGFQFPDIAINAFFYRWEKSFVRVTWKLGGDIFCYINGEKYNFYSDGEQVILEITDKVRANAGGGGTISIRDYNDDYLYDLEYENIEGQRIDKSNESYLPFQIPYSVTSVISFWVELCQKQDYFSSANEWVAMTTANWITDPSQMPMEMDLKTFDTDTFRISDTTNFEINETSGVYGFGLRTVNLKKGETYKLSANGNSAGAAIGAGLRVYILKLSGTYFQAYLKIDNDADTTASVSFEAPETTTYRIGSFYYPQGAPAGTVTVNWYKVELMSGAQTRLIDLPCTNEHILFEWTGRFGVKKSWWFKKESVISEVTKTINLQTMDSGFNTLKDKNTNIVISHRNADNLTQHYLSDIVLSDEVFCYPDDTAANKLQVRVETNSFEVGLNNRDIVLTINKNAYDTI